MKRTNSVAVSHDEAIRQKTIIEKLKHRLQDRQLTYYITTFGCQMNAHDSEMIKGILEDIGYREALQEMEADFVIYNTCAVRENAEQRVYGRIGHLKSIKRKKPEMMIALCGCMMQQPTVIQELKKKHKHIDLVFGTHNLYKLAELLETRLDSGSAVYDIWDAHKEIVEDLPTIRKHKFKASVNIMYGCNNFCTYCIVPYVRGRERSRHPEDILKEVKDLVEDGVVEIVLLGQNVNSYGTGINMPMTFAELICEVEKVEGLRRIRFMTPHPKDLSDDLIEVMAASKKICHHVHLPIQSGSTRLLKAMNRHYTKESYLDLVKRIKAKMPDVAITTDLIIGFPSETEADNEDTIDVIHQVEYNTAYTFIYSKRTGTPAANMEEQVPETVVKERFNKILEAMDVVSLKNSGKHVGKIYELLVEEVNHKKADWVSGRLEDNHLVHIQGDKSLIGTFVNVKITGSKTYYLVGEII